MKHLNPFDLGSYNKPYKTKEKIIFQIGDEVLFVENQSNLKNTVNKLYSDQIPAESRRLNKINKLKDFLRNNVGKIIDIQDGPFVDCTVEYSNIPDNLVNCDYLDDYGFYYCDNNIFVFKQNELKISK